MAFGAFTSTYIPTDCGEFNIYVLPELIQLGSQNGIPVSTILDHYAMVPVGIDTSKKTVIHLHQPNRHRDLFLPAYFKKKGIPELLLSKANEKKDGVILSFSRLSPESLSRLQEGLDMPCEYNPPSFEEVIARFSAHLNLLPTTLVEFADEKLFEKQDHLPENFEIHTLNEVVEVKIPSIALERIFPESTPRDVLFRKHLTHTALVNSQGDFGPAPFLRVHSSCETGDIHNAQTCDCGQQFRLAISKVVENGGVVIYDDAEGRGSHWLSIKMLFYKVTSSQGLGTYDAMASLGYARNEDGYGPDLRTFKGAVELLKSLGISTVTLGTNNQFKVLMLTKAGIKINGRINILPEIRNQITKKYLIDKSIEGGHTLHNAISYNQLDFCGFTGADDATSIEDLVEISALYPFVEWGMSFSVTDAGQPRYPTFDWIKKFLNLSPLSNKAAHLSYEGLSVFANDTESEIYKLAAHFPRIQLNLHSNPSNTKELMQALRQRIIQMPKQEFIVPYCAATSHLMGYFEEFKNVAMLFDESKGNGQSPTSWPQPVKGRHCGYAGGISPDNVKEVIQSITKIVPIDEKCWLDMESGVRTENQFDLKKVVKVCEIMKDAVFSTNMIVA